MRITIPAVLACVLALPAGAQTLSVPMCEETASGTDTAVREYLALPNPTFDDEAGTSEEINSFEDFCVDPYMCPDFESRWDELRGENFLDPRQYEGKPTFFTDAFAELTAACGRK